MVTMPSIRYSLAFFVNVLLPAAAYRIASTRFGPAGALIASALPLIAWMCIDFKRFRHFDALSAVVLAGVGMSLLVLASSPARWLTMAREPLVSGVIGVLFLSSLLLERPLIYYLARSTLSREQRGRELEFDATWRTQPALVRSIRFMTAVWGVGLVAENLARLWLTYSLNDHDAQQASTWVRYAFYGGLTLWTIFYRRNYIKRRVDTSTSASSSK
ncbi:VC0807 family protein [Caballeronia terrestris]|nr:VC0807 family protein [Caballeronia terrestris]